MRTLRKPTRQLIKQSTNKLIGQLTEQSIEKSVKQSDSEWFSIIFHADKIIKNDTESSLLELGSGKPLKRLYSGLALQFIDPDSRLIEVKTVLLHPGTNMGIHTRQETGKNLIERFPVRYWNEIIKNKINQWYQSLGAFEIIYPEQPDDIGEPGYRHFSEEDAIKLIKYHTSIDWVNRAAVGETRSAVLQTVEKQREIINRMISRRTT